MSKHVYGHNDKVINGGFAIFLQNNIEKKFVYIQVQKPDKLDEHVYIY